jgi:hypothetical protein
MRIEIVGTPEFQIPMTLEQVKILMVLSATHYDSVCRQASQRGESVDQEGFVYRWHALIKACSETPKIPGFDNTIEPLVQVRASWRQIDMVLKILEGAPQLDPLQSSAAMCLRWDLVAGMESARPEIRKWHVTIETNVDTREHRKVQ